MRLEQKLLLKLLILSLCPFFANVALAANTCRVAAAEVQFPTLREVESQFNTYKQAALKNDSNAGELLNVVYQSLKAGLKVSETHPTVDFFYTFAEYAPQVHAENLKLNHGKLDTKKMILKLDEFEDLIRFPEAKDKQQYKYGTLTGDGTKVATFTSSKTLNPNINDKVLNNLVYRFKFELNRTHADDGQTITSFSFKGEAILVRSAAEYLDTYF